MSPPLPTSMTFWFVALALWRVAPASTLSRESSPDRKIAQVRVGTPRRFLGNKADVTAKQVSLVKQKAKDPGYFRNWGVRGPVDSKITGFSGMDEEFDRNLDRNFWEGDSMSYDFRVLDNLEPTAPMDRIWAQPGQIKNPDDFIAHVTGWNVGGFTEPAFIPKHMNPDLFPTVVGSGCNCTMPLKPGQVVSSNAPKPGTEENCFWLWNKDWGRLLPVQQKAAKTLGWTEDTWQKAKPPPSSSKQWKELSKDEKGAAGEFGWTLEFWLKRYEKLVLKTDPDFLKKLAKSRQESAAWPEPSQKIECKCGKKSEKDHYTWLKATPLGKGKYTLTPADISYRGGNYWAPRPEQGIQSPSDRLEYDRYPNQASADHIWPLPASSREDRVAIKYARYIDQVSARSEECDTISKKCTTPCRPGDEVIAAIGNTKLKAKIGKVYVGNAAEVEFTPTAAVGAKATTDCPLTAGCTAFRFCRKPGEKSPCVRQEDIDTHNWAGNLRVEHRCPKGTKLCKAVKQVVAANYLVKDGKACKAAFKKEKKEDEE